MSEALRGLPCALPSQLGALPGASKGGPLLGGVSSFGFCGVIAHAVVEAAAAVLASAPQVALPNPNPNPCPTLNPNPIPNQASSPLRFARRSYAWEPLLSGATAAAQQAAEEAAFFITCWAAQPARYPIP